ncbi:uncharacterized protein LOC132281931 [Cornus florida]|uniref:uncharacterized protein LOC132281931 n=1 Tax=Cornus florida TaxID=4283 RepID=UPI002899ADA4|nr:uncharacterized protein LOC132281931 [Cornus florida]
MSSSIDSVTPLVSDLWKSLIKEEGQIFDGIVNVRDVLHKFALANRFMFNYKKAWRGKEKAKEAVDGGPFHGYMLKATALDANNGIYPVAFKIVKSESLENWLWFLENLKAALNEDREIIIISDRSQSIISAVRQVYSDEMHAHCFRHLKENFLKFLEKYHLSKATKGTLEDHLDIIAYTFQVKACDRALDRMKRLCAEAYDWVIESEPKHWAKCQFPKKRYGKLYSNVAESFNGWVLKERELPIMGIIEKTREKLTKYIYKRKNKAILWKLLVGKRIDEILALNVKLGEKMQIMSCSTHIFEVREIHGNFGVDIERKSCGCGKWEATGLPCENGCATTMKANLNVYDFVEECYHKETQCQIYSETMRPVPTHDMPSLDFFEDETDDDGYINELSEPDKLLPPRCKKPPGRPRRK